MVYEQRLLDKYCRYNFSTHLIFLAIFKTFLLFYYYLFVRNITNKKKVRTPPMLLCIAGPKPGLKEEGNFEILKVYM